MQHYAEKQTSPFASDYTQNFWLKPQQETGPEQGTMQVSFLEVKFCHFQLILF